MSAPSVHDDWLSLIEISGPFLAIPVLKEAFPQGLEELDGIKRKRLRQAYEEWREALELEDAQFSELHGAWIDRDRYISSFRNLGSGYERNDIHDIDQQATKTKSRLQK